LFPTNILSKNDQYSPVVEADNLQETLGGEGGRDLHLE
jgi:hypothetical protein